MSELAISVRGLGKRYRLRQVETGAARARRRLLKRGEVPHRWVLSDVNFDVAQGEAVAIVGRNGAGKSTLLKILSRITEPTAGYADIVGRVGSLLEVGTGFHPELTGRQNVYLNGTILGMTREEIRSRFDEIVEFSGVGTYIDTPVKWYSSGMYVRLAFSVAAHLEPEIMMIDEVLAVGDAEFQKRCLGRMSDIAKGGRTVLFVSHNMQAVQRLCDKAILLEDGKLVEQGPTDVVVRRYLAGLETPDEGRWADDEQGALGNALCQIREVRLADDAGRPRASFFSSRPIVVTIEFDLERLDPAFVAGFDLTTFDGSVVFRSMYNDVADDRQPRLVPGRNALQCVIPPGLLNSGRYSLNLRVALHWSEWIAFKDNMLMFDVVADHGESLFLNDRARPGVIAPILDWTAVEPGAAAPVLVPERLQASA